MRKSLKSPTVLPRRIASVKNNDDIVCNDDRSNSELQIFAPYSMFFVFTNQGAVGFHAAYEESR